MTPKALARRMLSPAWRVRINCVRRGLPVPRWGNFRRLDPFSRQFGYERGTPIDRYYIHRFFDQWRALITGDVLEIQTPYIGTRFGQAVRRVDSIDIAPRFAPTYLCDLAAADDVIPSDAYDCFVLPQTFHYFRDLDTALRQALRVVRPGGHILATCAAIGQLDTVTEYWRMSPEGWREAGTRAWPGCDISLQVYGNCLAATAAIQGLAAEELTPAELDVYDERWPVVIGIRCRKG